MPASRRRRGVSEATVFEVAGSPEQLQAIRPGREVRQSRIADEASGKLYVVRVIVDTAAEGDTVVTVYRSSKIDKYWSNT
jgi:hypothetical protein